MKRNYLQQTVILVTTLLLTLPTAAVSIVMTDTIKVSTPVGHAPRLPYRLWVANDDGQGEYRQVRWMNSQLATEQTEANAAMTPVGTLYEVKGFITGDDTTPDGYPVTAQIKVVATPWTKPSPQPVAEPLPLSKDSIDGNNRLTWNRQLDIDHLLSLDVKQMLYNYRDTYGQSTDGYPVAEGWDSPTTKLKGHGSGHYMSALALAFACCDDAVKKDQLRQNIRQMVDELRRCQELTFVWNDQLGRYWEARDVASDTELLTMKGSWHDFDRYKQQYRQYGYGYLNAIPAQHCILIENYCPYNNDTGVWAPYYTVHKQLAGLIDIATYVDDPAIAAKALLTAKDMGLWVWNRLHYRTYVKTTGTTEERRAKPGNRYEMWNMYIAGEVGGMAESLARLSEMVTEPVDKQRLLEAAGYFDSPAFFDPVARNVDAIRDRHANQHIPMVTGALRIFRNNGRADYYHLAQNFWTMVQGRYRYATGGVGNAEMFRQPYTQIASMCNNTSGSGQRKRPDPTLNETCCAYNLAKLTKDLNCYNPDDASYMDYYERVLYNQIVGSLNPRHYGVIYHYALGLNASKPWGNETPQTTCCGGTGAENHVKYQEAAYFVSNSSQKNSTLWVALYMPTTAHWDAQGVVIRQECQWPAESSVIRIVEGSSRFAMKLRVPYWATRGFDVKLNGKSLFTHYQPGSYVTIPARKWTKKDVVEVTMPFTPHIDYGPDKMQTAVDDTNGSQTEYTPLWTGAFMLGPLVMTTTGITTWDEATIVPPTEPRDIQLQKPLPGIGPDANLYTMTYRGMRFIPDYHADRNTTHYFRMKSKK